MTGLFARIATLGPVGRLHWRLATVLADVLGLALGLGLAGAGFPLYAAITAVVVFSSAALLRSHRQAGLGFGHPVLPRVAGALVAMGAGPGPVWFFPILVASYVASGQLRIPPVGWFSSWLPAEASQVADDLVAGAVIVTLASLTGY